MQEYYANPTNQFWTILERVYKQSIGTHYEQKRQFLRKKRLALWDVLHSAEREGSSDGNIKNARPNNFEDIFADHPNIEILAFNGTQAEKRFRRHVLRDQTIPEFERLRKLYLPSTSAAPGKYVLPLDQKIEKWQAIQK